MSRHHIVRQLFAEVIPLFPDQNFHLGGDEVATACWKADASITEWMRNNGYAVYPNALQAPTIVV